MHDLDEASARVLRWRIDGLGPRVGQTALIGVLLWVQIRSPVAIWWVVAAIGAAVIDALLSRGALERPGDRALSVLNAFSRTISAAAFAVVCLVMLIDKTGFGLTAAAVVGCATNLNNVVMTRGSRRFFASLVLPSTACLVGLPGVAWMTGHSLSGTGALLLTVGTGGYSVFIVLLARALFNESQALREALEAAEAASRAKSTFLAVTSHEIRTPLNGVLGMAQAMENDPLSAVQRERVGVIRQSGEALLDILNDILDLAKVEAGKLELEAAPFDLEAVARSAVGAFSATALAKNLAYGLEFDAAAGGVFVGDAARLRQVLCNLISNAVKFTESGEVAVFVTAGAQGVRLCVRDTGPGIPAALAERLFEKFTQADASTTRRYGGTGLGLAICRDLCAAMGGTISVAGDEGGGSIFTVELPLARGAAGDARGAGPEPAAAARLAPRERPLRVLAAEDNAVNQLVLRTLLGQVGAEVTIVGDGAEAVRAWEAGEFDVILMDVQMPQMDGPTAARTIREREPASGRARVPIIALTADVMSHQLEGYRAAGMEAFVAKPIAIAELYEAIARVTGEAAAEADRNAA